MISIILAVGLTAQPDIVTRYDRVRDDSNTYAHVGRCLNVSNGVEMDLVVGYAWKGKDRPPVEDGSLIQIGVVSTAERARFLKSRDMAILADGSRFRPEPIDRDLDFNVKQGTTQEVLFFVMPFRSLKSMAMASDVEIAVGPEAFVLSAEQRDGIKELMAQLAIPSQEVEARIAERKRAEEAELAERRLAEAVRRKAEEELQQAAVQVRADALAYRRQWLDKVRPDFAAVIEKARKAASRFPKSHPELRDKARWRAYDEAMPAVIAKHKLSKRDVDELLSEFPDFQARFSIR